MVHAYLNEENSQKVIKWAQENDKSYSQVVNKIIEAVTDVKFVNSAEVVTAEAKTEKNAVKTIAGRTKHTMGAKRNR